MTQTPFEAYQMFVAIRNHMTSDSYDIVKYNGKVRVNKAAFDKRKDKFQFEKLSRMSDNRLRTAATFVEGGQWINDVVGEPGHSALLKHRSTIDALTFNFTKELSKVDKKVLASSLHCDTTPPLIFSYHGKKLSLESMIVLDDILRFTDEWTTRFCLDPVVTKTCRDINKFRAFFSYNPEKFRQIFVEQMHK